MADRWAVQNGNWSSTSTWDGGTLPAAGDDVYADGRTVTIDQNVTVLSVRTTQRSGGTAGGGFTLNAGFTLTANVIAGTSVCVNFASASPSSATIIGNCTAGSGTNCFSVNHDSTGTLVVTGNCTGGSNTNAHGAINTAAGTLTITGNCTGGSNASAYGTNNGSTGTVTINGSAIGSSIAAGAINGSTGLMSVKRAVGNGWGIGSVGINSVPGVQSSLSSSQTRVEELEFGSLGQSPVTGAVSVPDLATNVCLVHRLSAGKKTLIDPSASTGQANEADVRAGTSYALGNKTGTLAVPNANQVAVGVPVDNTVGTAVLTAQNVRDAVGLAAANLDTKFSDIINSGDIDGYTLEEALKIVLAALAGKVSGGGTSTVTFRAADDSRDRITATVTDEGNRTTIILDSNG